MDAHKFSQKKTDLLFSVSVPSSECLFLTGYFLKKKTVPKSVDNMTVCSCEITGNEDCKILVTIQYRRVSNINNQHSESKVRQFSHSALDPRLVIKVILENLAI